ncbi:Methyltransferase-like protein 21D [Entomortierella beljakovae]|nr:Methyltransferase-like protein 21D [Entomortierella beljakovae]
MDNITLASREFEFNDYSIEPLEIDEDPSGLLRGGVGSTIWDAAIVLGKYLERTNILGLATSSESTSPINILELGSGTGIVGLAAARLLSKNTCRHGSKVVLTDKENVVPLLQRNLEKNSSDGVELESRVLDWEAVSGIKSKASPSSTATSEADQSLETEPSASTTSPINTTTSSTTTTTETTTTTKATTTTTTTTTTTSFQDLLSVEWDAIILSDCIWVPGLYHPLIGTINALVKPGSKTQLILSFEKRNFSEEMEFFALLGKTFRFRDIKPEEQDPNYQSEDIYLFVCQRRT